MFRNSKKHQNRLDVRHFTCEEKNDYSNKYVYKNRYYRFKKTCAYKFYYLKQNIFTVKEIISQETH